MSKRRDVIENPDTCAVRECWNVIDRRWRICKRCWARLPPNVVRELSSLQAWCARTPAKHEQVPDRLSLPHFLYRLVWRESMTFLNTGELGSSLPWRSTDAVGAFAKAHDEAKATR